MNIPAYYPHVKVEVVTERGNLVLRGQHTPGNIDSAVMANDVLSVMTKRDLGSDCPTFSVTLSYRNEWFSKLGSNDLIIISMCRPPEEIKPVMFGLLDDIRKSSSVLNGKPTRTLVLTGRGFNKAFVNFELGTIKEAQLQETSVGFMYTEITLAALSASEAVKTVLESYAKKFINYDFGAKGNFISIVDWILTSNSKETLSDTVGLLDYQGSMWNLLKELQNSPFNELFWEIGWSGRPTMYMRPTPFNPEHWNVLPVKVLDSEDIIEESVGKSDLETYTLYNVGCRSFTASIGEMGSLGYLPLWYKPYFYKYGIKRLSVLSLYALYGGREDTDSMKALVEEYTEKIYNWNIKNNSALNGNFSVKGKNSYRIGEVLKTPDNYEYYIESVSHNFNIFNSFTTQLGVTRGLPVGERFTSPWGTGEKFEASDTPKLVMGSD